MLTLLLLVVQTGYVRPTMTLPPTPWAQVLVDGVTLQVLFWMGVLLVKLCLEVLLAGGRRAWDTICGAALITGWLVVDLLDEAWVWLRGRRW